MICPTTDVNVILAYCPPTLALNSYFLIPLYYFVLRGIWNIYCKRNIAVNINNGGIVHLQWQTIGGFNHVSLEFRDVRLECSYLQYIIWHIQVQRQAEWRIAISYKKHNAGMCTETAYYCLHTKGYCQVCQYSMHFEVFNQACVAYGGA